MSGNDQRVRIWKADEALFPYGFAKSERNNIDRAETEAFNLKGAVHPEIGVVWQASARTRCDQKGG